MFTRGYFQSALETLQALESIAAQQASLAQQQQALKEREAKVRSVVIFQPYQYPSIVCIHYYINICIYIYTHYNYIL